MHRTTVIVSLAALAAGTLVAVAMPRNAPGSDPAIAVNATPLGFEHVQLAQAAEPHPAVSRFVREGWKTDFSKVEIDLGEILSGGPAKDGIPSIDDPTFIPVSEETELPDREPVLSFELNGDARAYPIRVMMWHEIVNDEVGGVPVAVTYCPLCNAAIVFDATVDGTARDFGTTGKLRHSDLVMYDRETESWWQQFSGKGLAGAHAGEQLAMLPSQLVPWGAFKADHPDGKVLIPNNPAARQYWRNPYGGYDTANRPFLFSGALPEGIPAMERVVYIRGDEPKAIAVALLMKEGEIVEDGIRIAWDPGQASALDSGRISEGRDVGTVSVTRVDDGEPVVHDVTFAFVVNAFQPALEIRQPH